MFVKNKYGGDGLGGWGLIERGGFPPLKRVGGTCILESGAYLRGGALNRGFMGIDKLMVITEPAVHCSKHTSIIRPGFEIISQQRASHAQQRSYPINAESFLSTQN